MTPEQKARELVKRFCVWSGHNDAGEFIFSAKQCALIAVDNEEQALNRFAEYWDLKTGEWYLRELETIKQVKTEIEQL